MKNYILHICNDFLNSRVHRQLYSKLDQRGLKQIIFYPFRRGKIKDTIDFVTFGSTVLFSDTLQRFHRLIFKRKIRFLYQSLKRQVDPSDIALSHATTLFSDGVLSYKLYKAYNIPYIVTIRNTDLNLFFKYMVHLRKLGIDILKNAEQIIFISPSYKRRLFDLPYLKKFENEFEDKSIVIPNGINNFWIKNVQEKKIHSPKRFNLLYIGNFSKEKNVLNLIRAVNLLNKDLLSFHLILVGEGGGDYRKVMKLIEGKTNFKYLGKINDKIRLKEVFAKSDIFTMPSRHETFGLVYIEAFSQGLPVIYTKDEGIAGFYDSIGEAVDSYSIEDIARGIKTVYENYEQYRFSPKEIVKNHDWDKIALQYKKIYHSIISK